jgi:rhodanese-related sulfurtransferase
MKYKFSILCFFLLLYQFIVFAQNLPLVQAKATQKERYYDWLPEKPKDGKDNPEGWVLGECREGTSNTKASSYLASQGISNYKAENLSDDDPTTAWVEGKTDYGIGEFVEFMAFPYASWCILNGYQKDKITWENNSRVRKLRVFIESKPTFEVLLEDKMGIQIFQLPDNIKIDPDKISTGTKIKIMILDVYEGKKFKDVAISEIFFSGC